MTFQTFEVTQGFREELPVALRPEERERIIEAKAIGQGILMGLFVNSRITAFLNTPEGKGMNVEEIAEGKREEFAMSWMLTEEGTPRFSKILGDIVELARSFETGTSLSSADRLKLQEALRFTRGLIELSKAGKPVPGPMGYLMSLTPAQGELADKLQKILDRIEHAAPGRVSLTH